MEQNNRIEEILEFLWIHTQEGHNDHIDGRGLPGGEESLLKEMAKKDLITLDNGSVKLTEKGIEEGRHTIRRHRLAELLLTEVINVKGNGSVNNAACEFEHLLKKGIDEKVCTLLSHPEFCPHGKPIPHGKCCEKKFAQIDKSVTPLSSLNPKQKGKVAYLRTNDSKEIHKLMAMGLVPGTSIKLIRRSPSFVFRLGYSEFAVDQKIANEIFIRLAN
jgi:DtxR family Mn-dependent transcriptional regulator